MYLRLPHKKPKSVTKILQKIHIRKFFRYFLQTKQKKKHKLSEKLPFLHNYALPFEDYQILLLSSPPATHARL